MKRNKLFAATSLVFAGALVGAGMMISSSAMAETGTSSDSAEVTVGIASAKGDVVECSLSGAEAEKFLGGLKAGTAPEGLHSVSGRAVAGTVTMEDAESAAVDVSEMLPNGDAGEGVTFGAAVVPADGSSVDVGGEIDPALPVDPMSAQGFESLDSYVVRVGTSDECTMVLGLGGDVPSAETDVTTGD